MAKSQVIREVVTFSKDEIKKIFTGLTMVYSNEMEKTIIPIMQKVLLIEEAQV